LRPALRAAAGGDSKLRLDPFSFCSGLEMD
jgi:hypothetical protein